MKPLRVVFATGIVTGLLAGSIHAQSLAPEQKQPAPRRTQGPPRTYYVGTPPNFGTVAESWYRLGAAELDPDTSATAYTSTWNPENSAFTYQRYVSSGYPHLIGFVHIPGGSTLDAWQVSYCDDNAGPPHMQLNLYACDFYGGCSSPPVVGVDTGAFSPGCASVTVGGGGLGFTADNKTAEYLVDIVFSVFDGTQRIAGTGFGYHLQVSPAPGSPTFNDVPLNDPGFQYIEALVASGITAGCGSGNYCPGSPLTRRQMAVFLAKALGLNWPDR